ncbi:MAG TPA: ROK family protein, partial [Acidimicrobiales bacterium]|nr:ROK family protein [Acidimicrobiales bacterium]
MAGAGDRRTLGFGVDIGGSGIKGAPVDLVGGGLAQPRVKLPTPQPSTPEAVAATVAQVVHSFAWAGPIGCTMPAVVTAGTVRTAANVDPTWIGTNAEQVLGGVTGLDVTAVNDADAAGLAEVAFGAARGQAGLVIVVTLGTGIGTAVVHQGRLLPNTELGHLEVDGHDAESHAADAVRKREGLGWKKWAKRLQGYFEALERYFWPDLFVVGGGVSRKADKFLPLLSLRTPIVPARLQNDAGIVGAAALAARRGGVP